MREILHPLLEGNSLTRSEAERAMDRILDGLVTPEQIGAFLAALRIKRESADEISGFLDCLQKRSIRVALPLDNVMDVCGTGGDGAGTFNISTTVAFVVTAAGQPIAKHGNRSVSSRSGSFDVLEALGIAPESEPAKVSSSISKFGIGLLFAPAFQPALKTLAPVRKNLGVHTVFNALGVLMNPARVKRQLIGVYSPHLLETLAEVLGSRGTTEAMIVRGEDGLDEFSLSAPTRIAHLKNSTVRNYTLSPKDFGLKTASIKELEGGTAQENARILVDILKSAQGPKRDVVLMNAAAALMVGGLASNPKEGVEQAANAIDSGRALELLRSMQKAGEVT